MPNPRLTALPLFVAQQLETAFGWIAGFSGRVASGFAELMRLPEPHAPRQSALAELRMPLHPATGNAGGPLGAQRAEAAVPAPHAEQPFAHWAFVHMVR